MTKLAFFSDLHYYSSALGTEGKAYGLRESCAQTCLKESNAILTALCNIMKSNDADAVVLPGDITNDGERECHEEAIGLLSDLDKVKPVYAITATHDWCSNGLAVSYEGENVVKHTNVVSSDELPSLYEQFGKNTEADRFVTSLKQISRSFVINNEVLLIAVNDDCDCPDGKSGYSEDHLRWVEKQIEYAKANNLCPIAIQHHLLLHNVSGLVNKGQSIGDNFAVAEKLADMGLRLMVTGHSHFQRSSSLTTKKGNKITQLNLCAISGYPGVITYITVKDGKGYISEEPYTFEYNGRICDIQYLKECSSEIFTRIIHSGYTDRDDFIEVLGNNGIKGGWIKSAYPVIKKLCRTAETITVGKAAKELNRLCMKKVIDMNNVESVKDELLLNHLKQTFLNIFWWQGADSQSDDVKAIVMSIGRLVSDIIKKLPLRKKKEGLIKISGQIEELVHNLEYPEKNPEFVELL